jgi:amino acid transporter
MGFKDAGMWLFTPVGEIVMAVVISIYCLIINMLGMKWYARIMKGWFILGVLGFITWMAIAALSAQTSFVSGFNNWMQTYMGVGGNSFQQVIDAAAGAGFNPTPAFSWWDTLLICPIVSFVLAWFGWPTFQLGEIRGMDSLKNQIYWIVLGTLTAVGISIGIYVAVTSFTGMAFFNSVAYNFYQAIGPLTIPPYYVLFFATLTSNPWLMLWIILAANGFAWSWFTEFVLSPSRVIFAAAFDRVLPSWLASVKTRFRIPVNAMLLVTVTNILFSAVFFLWTAFSGIWLAATVWGLWVQLSTVLAGMIWPWRNRELFKTSIAGRFKVGEVPLITLLGIPYVIWTLFMLYLFLSPEYGGFYGTNSTASIIFLIGVGIIHLAFFYAYKWKNKRQGMDVDLIYKEIPVE